VTRTPRLWTLGLVALAVGSAAQGQDPSAIAEPSRLAEAANHVRAGETAEALALVEGFGGSRAVYLRARLHDRLHQPAEAAEAYAAVPVAALPEAVRETLPALRARALARAGECAEALPLLTQAGDGVARALAGECALRLGRPEEAIPHLRAAAREDAADVDTFAVRYELAEALEATGKTREAREELKGLYVERGAHPDAELALQRLMDTGGLPQLDEEEHLRRAEALLDAWRPAEAAAELDGPVPFNRARKARWLHLRGMALFKTRQDYAEAAQVLAQAARVDGPTAIYDEFHSARALSRADEDLRAIRAYRRLVRRHPGSPWAARAEYLAAWLELRLGRFGGERRMEAFLEGPRATTVRELREDATWQLGLAAYEAERWGSAAARFARFAQLGEGPMEKGRGLYWRGRALEKAGETERAQEAFRAARAVDPLHYYGVLADRRLRALGIEEAIPLGDPDEAPDAMAITVADAARFYRALGLDSEARAALRRSEPSLREQAPAGRVNETLVRAHLQAHSYTRAYRLAALEHARLRERPEGDAQWAWEAAYPRPAFDTVVPEARRWGIPWSLPYAVMRQESAYDPDVVSGAGAIGLMQVMPEVGRDRGGAAFGVDMLFVPETNVRLGIAELAGAIHGMDGEVPLAIAAYNAGVARVNRWRRETGPIDFDLWVEKIPFDETRNYVRRVLSHFAHYRFVATGEATLPVPERVLPPEGEVSSNGDDPEPEDAEG